ncbi:DUF1697 domain-containing protein [Psychroserpens sp. XS_ASV72]|uniref:DUF1697 domain-containing protein n=1 Tax=Psychroserpens sp. XS_ASV72 TaxID=3241293 RepID=UPI003517ED51
MNTYIALLRGINVGGHKKVPMAELRKLLTNSGFENVSTYIQSGNVILNSSLSDIKMIEDKIQKSILEHFGFEVTVLVRTRNHFLNNFNNCPFKQEQKENSYFVLLSDVPKSENLEKVKDISYENETYQIIEDCLYFYSSVGYGNSKFNMNTFEKKLNMSATTRNYKTMVKLLSLSKELENRP